MGVIKIDKGYNRPRDMQFLPIHHLGALALGKDSRRDRHNLTKLAVHYPILSIISSPACYFDPLLPNKKKEVRRKRTEANEVKITKSLNITGIIGTY